jgi:hypothetical protein
MGKDKIKNQTFCLIASGGHLWMKGYFDTQALAVRQRLRSSSFNICPACLVTKVLPKVRRQHRNWPQEKQLIAAIEIMEAQVRHQSKTS